MKTETTLPFSIKKRLILTSIGISTLLVLISWVLIFYETRHEIDEVYDARLGQSAKILALSMPHMLQEPPEIRSRAYSNWYQGIQLYARDDDSETPFGHPYEQNLMFQLITDDNVILSSPEAPNHPISNTKQPGFGVAIINDESWRRFQIKLLPQPEIRQETYLVVAEKQSIRQELINEIAVSTGLPQLILIPCLALTIVLLVNKFLQPIGELRQAIAQRNINKLDTILVPHPTTELAPLVQQLNYLLAELDKAWQREKRLTRTAAHELKTPLAVLRLNAENALKSQNKKELESDLQNILLSIERTDRLIQQLLMISKVEAKQDFQPVPVDLMQCLREVIASLAPLSLKQQQELSLHGPNNAVISGNALLLNILFSNIIDNAIRYSGKRSTIEVTVKRNYSVKTNKIIVLISDNGPPIPHEVRSKIFEKFFRAHTERGDGAGLGMSIAADIASMHQGKIRLLPIESDTGNVFEISFEH
ncbi:ATP-binding protein [Photobacterium sp. J15]|uniref:ATP-binding protein n=1 Tax=Photobacterium sp. J15 TaxID=265901 RepID=UPI0007E3DA5A|nr:ATP-binding protein [Photobacterium sp. J15]